MASLFLAGVGQLSQLAKLWYAVILCAGVTPGAAAEVVWRSSARRLTHRVESRQSAHHSLWSGGQFRARHLEHRGLYAAHHSNCILLCVNTEVLVWELT